MKNKGFTLMELLGSITILALIALIVFPAILNMLGDSQSKIDKAKQDYVISAAREYVKDNDLEVNTTISIDVDILIKKNYLKENMIDEEMTNDSVTCTKIDGTITYKYNEESD